MNPTIMILLILSLFFAVFVIFLYRWFLERKIRKVLLIALEIENYIYAHSAQSPSLTLLERELMERKLRGFLYQESFKVYDIALVRANGHRVKFPKYHTCNYDPQGYVMDRKGNLIK